MLIGLHGNETRVTTDHSRADMMDWTWSRILRIPWKNYKTSEQNISTVEIIQELRKWVSKRRSLRKESGRTRLKDHCWQHWHGWDMCRDTTLDFWCPILELSSLMLWNVNEVQRQAGRITKTKCLLVSIRTIQYHNFTSQIKRIQ